MNTPNYKRTKLACYCAYFTMSSIFCLPPLLFVTFHEMYGISWTLLGTLVLVNFCTQFATDMMLSLLAKRFNVQKILRITPLVTSLGLAVYALFPMLFPEHAYAGLLVGTVIFSVAAGLSEVLLSPTIAAIPSDDPQRDMSTLHSLYAFGIFSVAVISTLFIRFIGADKWGYLALFFAALPIVASVLFMLSPMPETNSESTTESTSGSKKRRAVSIALCFACIFFGSCSENAMSNWISGYMESALGIDKTIGDIFGLAMFAVLLGITRICYAKWGRGICRVLLIGMIGAAVCYIIVGTSSSIIASFIACIMTGIFTSMLWPGTLIMMDENVHGAGVAAYALMAAGGDLGASVAPQLLGVIADASDMQTGMLICSLFPIAGAIVVAVLMRRFSSDRKREEAGELE